LSGLAHNKACHYSTACLSASQHHSHCQSASCDLHSASGKLKADLVFCSGVSLHHRIRASSSFRELCRTVGDSGTGRMSSLCTWLNPRLDPTSIASLTGCSAPSRARMIARLSISTSTPSGGRGTGARGAVAGNASWMGILKPMRSAGGLSSVPGTKGTTGVRVPKSRIRLEKNVVMMSKTTGRWVEIA